MQQQHDPEETMLKSPSVQVPVGKSDIEISAHRSTSIERDHLSSNSEIAPSTTSIRRGTGPRTLKGKDRSKQNATKHGIFSGSVVLKDESRSEYESLLRSLSETCQPEGRLEEILVEKLTMILWRHRRLLQAEAGEIGRNVQFLKRDKAEQQRAEAVAIRSSEEDPFESKPLIHHISNPEILTRCLRLLEELRDAIKSGSFERERDTSFLTSIYGGRDEDQLEETLYDTYSIWLGTSECSEEERQHENYATPSQCRDNVLEAIDSEIRRLNSFKKSQASVESERSRLEILRRSIPDGPGLERLLKYEASLERSFDRTLNQLERLQRMRLGQPVAPSINVQLSS
jgi:hypothetical protein